MKCPFCLSVNSEVVDVQMARGQRWVKRRRRCIAHWCGRDWVTVEKTDFHASLDRKYRGENWAEARSAALARDGHACRSCGATKRLAVHHIRPYREFRGDYAAANKPENLKTLCPSCHAKEEGGS